MCVEDLVKDKVWHFGTEVKSWLKLPQLVRSALLQTCPISKLEPLGAAMLPLSAKLFKMTWMIPEATVVEVVDVVDVVEDVVVVGVVVVVDDVGEDVVAKLAGAVVVLLELPDSGTVELLVFAAECTIVVVVSQLCEPGNSG